MNTRKKYKISVIEPSLLLSEGLKTVFQSNPDFEITSCVPDIPRFFERPRITPPDIILINPIVIDFQRQHHAKSIFPTYPDSVFIAIIYQFIDQDILKQYDGSIMVFDDGHKIQKKLNQAINRKKETPATVESFDLSDREKEILISVVKGLQNKEIADIHHISIHTVISHRKNIARKTGIKSVAGLTVYALLHQLLDPNEIE